MHLLRSLKRIKKIKKSLLLILINVEKNILYNQKYEYPIFTVMDSVTEYCGQYGTGLYYIESDNYIPLRGNGWYYYPMVDYCLQQNIT